MIIPELAVEEIATLRPEADGVLWRLKRHPQVLIARMDATRKAAIEAIREYQPLADVTAAWVVIIARERGWTVLSADPEGCVSSIPTYRSTWSESESGTNRGRHREH